MTISTNYEPVKYTGNSVTTVFTFAYPFFSSSDLLVYLDGVLQSTGYTVTGGSGSSGEITFSSAPTTGVIITIELSLPYTQLDNYVENQAFPADTLEKGLDRAAIRDQQLANSIERSLVFPATLSGSLVGELPQPVDDKMLTWDGTTGLVKNGPSAADVSSVLSDATTAAATATAQAAIATTKASEASASAAAAASTVGSITYLWASTATGTSDALVLTPTPAITSYAAGQKFRFIVSASANTTATPTVNVSGQGAKNIKKTIGGALGNLAVGDLVASTIAEIEYDGTQFQLLNIRSNSQGADIASSGTINLSTATGDYVNVTGTTTITAITLAQGLERTVKFAGILTLTNGASLILPSGANITTAAGDVAIFRGEASGVVRCVAYTKANGQAVASTAVGSYQNNGYALNRYNFGLATAATSGAAVTANRLYAVPYVVGATTTFTRIGINVTSAIAGNARLGIYNWADGVPSTLVLDCGTVSTSSTGDKEITISQSLTAGVYALAVVFDAAPSVAVANERNLINYLVGDVSSTGNNVFQYMAHTYGALPASFSAPTYTGTASPVLWMRKV